ncbi:MAG: GspMb/PilO family protein [Phycisphaerae bacterium]
MILCRQPLILMTDLVGAASVLGILVLVTVTLAVPMAREWNNQPAIESELARTRELAVTLQQRRAKFASELRDATETLRTAAPQPLADVGKLLERIATHCAAADVELLEVTPTPAPIESRAAVLQWQARVQARGTFPQVFSVLRELESWSPYLEIRDLALNGPPNRESSSCDASWTLRLSYLRPAADLPRPDPAESNP